MKRCFFDVYEEQGDNVKVIQNYEKFLDPWKDADPGIAEDVRKRIGKMGGY